MTLRTGTITKKRTTRTETMTLRTGTIKKRTTGTETMTLRTGTIKKEDDKDRDDDREDRDNHEEEDDKDRNGDRGKRRKNCGRGSFQWLQNVHQYKPLCQHDQQVIGLTGQLVIELTV